MQFSYAALIKRARVYIDDDHNDQDGFLAPDSWLTIAAVEYAELYRKWIRMGLIVPAATDTAFTGTTSIAGALAIIGVAEDMGTYRRLLAPATSAQGVFPFWQTSTTGKATSWTATGSGDTLAVTLDPPDPTGSYVVRWIPTVAYPVLDSETVELPYGADERMVLGIARRSNLKPMTNSQLLNGLIAPADAELAFSAFSKSGTDSPRVRRVRPTVRPQQAFAFPGSPSAWTFI